VTTVLVAEGGAFEPPSLSDFWQPYIGEGNFALTRPMTLMVFSTVLIVVVMLAATRRLSVVPTRGQAATEGLYDIVRNSIGRDILGSKDFLRFTPLLFAMFLLILVNNLFGVIPVIQYPTMSRIGFPIAITAVVYLVYLFVGVKKRGVLGYLASLVPPGLPWLLLPLFFFLELVTFFITRPATLALRLFGNMFAGHMLLLLMSVGGEYMLLHGGPFVKIISAGPFGMAFILTIFELLVEFLQAYIFTLLAALYIAGSLADEH
jgi:F-type H+-transporting ATPase subunit a